jgi:hypothetical protein
MTKDNNNNNSSNKNNRVNIEKLVVAKLEKKLSAFYITRKFSLYPHPAQDIHFNIIALSTLRSASWCPKFRFYDYKFLRVYFSSPSLVLHVI